MLKTSELTGAPLDYWTARAEGVPAENLWLTRIWSGGALICARSVDGSYGGELRLFYRPSTDWAQGGPLIEKYEIDLQLALSWRAIIRSFYEQEGDTPLQAICRAVVCAAFGDEVGEVTVCD